MATDKCFPPGKSRHDKLISLTEKGRNYSLRNDSQLEVVETHVDGGLYTQQDGLKCDYALSSHEFETVILIELKGGDVKKGIRQITAVLEDFRKKYSLQKYYGRIVQSRSNPTDLKSNEWKKLSRLCIESGGDLKSKTNKIEDTLNSRFCI